MTDEEQEERQRQKERRRKAILLLLALLLVQTREELHGLVDQLAQGRMTPLAFGTAAISLLANSHAHAAYTGRLLAGSTTAFGPADVAFGHSVLRGQQPFMERFVADLFGNRYRDEDGNLRPDPIKARVDLYAFRLRGTANEAWVLTLPPDTLVYWHVGDTEDHCESCPELEANGPYTAADIPTVPGAGDTQCTVNCYCFLEAEGGDEGFPPRSTLEGMVS